MFDYHTHSIYSFDVDKTNGATIDEMCQQAIKIGLKGIAITDHYEIVRDEDLLIQRAKMTFDLKEQGDEIFLAKQKYRGSLQVLRGIELGSPAHDMDKTKGILSENSFDFIVVSCHRIREHNDFYFVDFEKESDASLKELWSKYLVELKEQIALGIGDSIAHITYPYRYFQKNNRHHVLDMENKYREYFAEILKLMIKKEIALEINTSGLRQGLGDTLPNQYIVDFYRELGGTKVIFGSDAHTKGEIGTEFLRE
ncbi:MAG: histidinol-phosphatase HisJ family protein [Anaerovoracaceae bacterium]